jgi:hypothetical protein
MREMRVKKPAIHKFEPKETEMLKKGKITICASTATP